MCVFLEPWGPSSQRADLQSLARPIPASASWRSGRAREREREVLHLASHAGLVQWLSRTCQPGQTASSNATYPLGLYLLCPTDVHQHGVFMLCAQFYRVFVHIYCR